MSTKAKVLLARSDLVFFFAMSPLLLPIDSLYHEYHLTLAKIYSYMM